MKKNNIITIMKKELARLFGDKNLVFSGIILQGLLIFVMYNFMGNMMSNLVSVDEDYKYRVSVINMPASINMIVGQADSPVAITEISEGDLAEAQNNIANQGADLLVKFPADFDQKVSEYDVLTAVNPAPHIQIWSDSATMTSMQAETIFVSILNNFERSMAKKFDINADAADVNYDLNTGSDFGMNLMLSMVPMLLIIIIYSSCLTVAPESIAGEKERGTLATILATPARRRDMALAKVLSVTIFGVLGAGVTFLGMMLSLPNIMDSDVNLMASYGAGDYLMILLVIISTVLVFISLLSVMSAYAKSVKEANSYATPFMIVSMVLGLSSLFTGGAVESFYYYLIPVFNTAQGLTGLFTGAVSVINITVTVMANIAFSLILVGLLAKMFSSERIIFDK